jgi:hypothetical protein
MSDTRGSHLGTEPLALTIAGLVSLLAGLCAMIVGAVAIVACLTAFSGWSIPLAMVALVVGALGLLLDWFRNATRSSTSAPGMAVVTGTAFVPQWR